MPIIISDDIRDKLSGKHGITRKDITQCFDNIEGGLLEDTREDHKSNPPTMWFISSTNNGKLIKIAYIQYDDDIVIKTAYEPNETEIYIYKKYAM
jgi:hypothetical protein